jgi:nitric oxide dioxygenase
VLYDVRRLDDARMYVWYETGAETALPVDGVFAGRMNLGAVSLPDNALYYLCGPIPFMQAVRADLLDRGVTPRDVQYEVFGPDLWQADLVGEPAPGAREDASAPR